VIEWNFSLQQVMPIGQYGVPNDMFVPSPWSDAAFTLYCQQKWNVTPDFGWAQREFGGDALHASSNIVFSNGELDPWRGGGVTRSISDTMVAILIPEVSLLFSLLNSMFFALMFFVGSGCSSLGPACLRSVRPAVCRVGTHAREGVDSNLHRPSAACRSRIVNKNAIKKFKTNKDEWRISVSIINKMSINAIAETLLKSFFVDFADFVHSGDEAAATAIRIHIANFNFAETRRAI
jgi:hypothetical protein